MRAALNSMTRYAVLAALLTVLAACAALAQAQDGDDMKLVSKDTPIQAVVGEEDGEGLWVVAADGTGYSVWTPEEVSLEAITAFQQTYRNKEVTLMGDIYIDKFGNLNIFVKNLPQ